ncbi:SRPBCC family protein [Janthinobacterium sp. 17J80-10]|uniref:SRPBCC family protein n=1 Tax=Janthinobacterium sp. 17J80-10 TaxID=2497863 RepID=UPI0010057B6C|nr:SRPBCC family protein [Janthinobacterium sp. 17J80-10]QAU35505.1 polyketide cyclase [Janthinobacterium sp. 17J80-10]
MLEACNNRYHLFTEWQFDAPLDLVWDAIFHAEAWPDWWKGAESVVTLERGDADGLGARQRYIWKGVLPYRLMFVTCVTRVEPLLLLEGRVEGDLEGKGCWRFLRGQGRTTVRYEWQVRTTKLWMIVLAPLAKPIFRWNHDAVMRAGGVGLARHLAARLA